MTRKRKINPLTQPPESGYQGWANYETWCVALWMDNEEPLYREALELARNTDDADELAQTYKETFGDMAPDLGATLWSDLLTSALSEVDWLEIARAKLEEVAE